MDLIQSIDIVLSLLESIHVANEATPEGSTVDDSDTEDLSDIDKYIDTLHRMKEIKTMNVEMKEKCMRIVNTIKELTLFQMYVSTMNNIIDGEIEDYKMHVLYNSIERFNNSF